MKPIALIVGGSSGIGKAICHRLKDEYQVINMSRRKNDEVENIYINVEEYESVKDSFSFCVEKYSKPEILIYSAGWVQPEHLLEIEPEIWQKQINVNLTGAFYVTKMFVKVCDKPQSSNEKKIIYISSTAGMRSSPLGPRIPMFHRPASSNQRQPVSAWLRFPESRQLCQRRMSNRWLCQPCMRRPGRV